MSASGGRILLVEDEVLVGLDMREMLEAAGYTVVGPASVVESALIQADKPLDAAVLDVNVGGAYVWPVAQVLARRNVPVLFVTGMDKSCEMPADFARSERLRKPVKASELISALGRAIDGRRAAARSR